MNRRKLVLDTYTVSKGSVLEQLIMNLSIKNPYDQKLPSCMEAFHRLVHRRFDQNYSLSGRRMDYVPEDAEYHHHDNQHIPDAHQDHPEPYGD